jgi:hypothetical protein
MVCAKHPVLNRSHHVSPLWTRKNGADSMRTSRFTIASLTFAVVVSLGCLWIFQNTAERQVIAADDASGAKLKDLISERIDVLKQIVELTVAAHAQSMASVDQVFHAKTALLKAQLEQTEAASERIAFLEQIKQLAVNREQSAKTLFEKGAGSENEILQTKAERLNAEIALERAKAG